ncbi:MAG: adenine phosphoribosyltransferase [Lachnospiraceae bacterium]|nr:adenine phosphoribosyltransferase [Lachnospiraceae bacterium]
MKKVEEYIKSIPDFPKEGVIFRDVTSVLESPEGYELAISTMNNELKGIDYDFVAGIESRGFIFGATLAYMNKKGFIPVRKKGKLPRETVEMGYDLEYGQAVIEIHKDAIKPGDKVVIVDDLLATGGTAEAAAKLVELLGGEVVKIVFLIELPALDGRKRLEKYDVTTIVTFDGE